MWFFVLFVVNCALLVFNLVKFEYFTIKFRGEERKIYDSERLEALVMSVLYVGLLNFLLMCK